MKPIAPLLVLLVLAACGRGERVNPPTEPAQPVTAPDAAQPAPDARVGTGAPSFVGRWAADVSWCAAPLGDRRPITITPTRFEGYENSCALAEINEAGDGYDARLACVSEGAGRSERVRMSVSGQVLTLDYLDRRGAPLKLTKCTTLDAPAPGG